MATFTPPKDPLWLDRLWAECPAMFNDVAGEEGPEDALRNMLATYAGVGVADYFISRPGDYVVTCSLKSFEADGTAYSLQSEIIVAKIHPAALDQPLSPRVGHDSPVPLFVLQVLDPATALEIDFDSKLDGYARLGIREYVPVDRTGEFLPDRLLLKRLQPDGKWLDEQDPDGGITSNLGFRLRFEEYSWLRAHDAASGEPILRPREVFPRTSWPGHPAGTPQEFAEAELRRAEQVRRRLDQRIERLKTEIALLREAPPAD